MAIQSSVNALMQQLYQLGYIGAGLGELKKQTKSQAKTASETETQTEIAAGNAPKTLEGKVSPEWLQQRRESFMIDPKVVSRLIKTNQELRKKITTDVARTEIDNRMDSINQSKKGFDEHIANLIREYGKGSERP